MWRGCFDRSEIDLTEDKIQDLETLLPTFSEFWGHFGAGWPL